MVTIESFIKTDSNYRPARFMKWVYRCLSAAFATLAVAMPLFDKPEERIPADPLGIIYHDITTDPGVGGYGQKAYRFDDRMVLVNLKNKQDDDLDHFDPDGFYKRDFGGF